MESSPAGVNSSPAGSVLSRTLLTWLCVVAASSSLKFPLLLWTRDLAVDLLLMIPDNELQLVKLCAFYPGCMEERGDLREKVVCGAALEFNWFRFGV